MLQDVSTIYLEIIPLNVIMKEFHALNRWKNLIYIPPFLVDYQWHMIMICDSCISDKPRHSRKSNLIKGLVVLQIKLSCIKTSNNIISFWSDVTILLHNKRYCQSISCLLGHSSLFKNHYGKVYDSTIVVRTEYQINDLISEPKLFLCPILDIAIYQNMKL